MTLASLFYLGSQALAKDNMNQLIIKVSKSELELAEKF